MALSDAEKEKDKKRKNRALDHPHARWSDNQKLEIAKSYMVLGNISMVARLHSIPRITIVKWMECQWWHDLLAELKAQEKIELSSKMKSLVDAAHQVVANRLEHGDAVLNQKTGQIVYKPVAMKDAHRVAVDLVNQRAALEKGTAGFTETSGNENKLEQLAEKFAEFATKRIEQSLDKKRTVEASVSDVTYRETDNAVEVVQSGTPAGEVLSSDGGRVQSVDEGTSEAPPQVGPC